MLELRGVCKSFGSHQVLQPTDLVVPQGRTVVLLGPSGCGKSTLLRVVVGLIEPDQGSVWLDNVQMTAENVLDLRHRIGYVIQDGGLFPHLTARENVTLMARYLRRPSQMIDERVQLLAELTHLPTDALDRYPTQISGGQRQRVSLMRALFLDPDVLLLDEPMGALDPMIRCELQEELRRIFNELEKIVVVVTHDISEAGYLGDVIALVRDGRIVQQGSLSDLANRPIDPFVTSFINAQRSPLDVAE